MVRMSFILFGLLATFVFAQETEYIRPGMLKASATITPSIMTAREVTNIYTSCFLEYHLDKRLSFRGETFIYVDAQSKIPWFDQGVRTHIGVFYHLNKGNFDTHLGFEPGLAVLKTTSTKVAAVPSYAVHLGSSFYVWKYFHFFADVAYTRSRMPNRVSNDNADEILFSAGLGYQIQTKHRYKEPFGQ